MANDASDTDDLLRWAKAGETRALAEQLINWQQSMLDIRQGAELHPVQIAKNHESDEVVQEMRRHRDEQRLGPNYSRGEE